MRGVRNVGVGGGLPPKKGKLGVARPASERGYIPAYMLAPPSVAPQRGVLPPRKVHRQRTAQIARKECIANPKSGIPKMLAPHAGRSRGGRRW